MLAAKQETHVFPLAAFCFQAENSRPAHPLRKSAPHQGWSFATSTSQEGCTFWYDGTASGRLVGLDYFGARYFSGAQGRFTSPDEPLVDQDPGVPQSWNLYTYGRNNPLRYTDPTGRCSQAEGGYTDEGKGLFPGPCANGSIGDTTKSGANSVTVTANKDGSTDYFDGFGQRAGYLPYNPAIKNVDEQLLVGLAVVRAGIGPVTALLRNLGPRVAPLAPLVPPAGDKLRQIMARLGPPYSYNREAALEALTKLRDAAAAAGNTATGYYLEAGSTIYKVGNNYLTISGAGKILSYVQDATPGEGVAARYVELGGK
jgi:RHS repeat-associated protein